MAVWDIIGFLIIANVLIEVFVAFKRANPELAKRLTFSSGKKSEEKPVVAVIRMNGIISAPQGVFDRNINWRSYEQKFRQAFEIPGVKAVCLEMNSPGGSPVQSNLFVKRLKQLQKEANDKKKDNEDGIEIVACVEDIAASGGYFIICAADTIVADENSIIGSIGVISSSYGLDKAIKKYDVERRLYTAGKNKGMGDMFSPMTPEAEELLNNTLESLHQNFINVVKESRGDKLSEETFEEIFSGAAWDAKTAHEFGLVDVLGEKYSYFKEKYGKKVRFIEMRQATPFERLFTPEVLSLNYWIEAATNVVAPKLLQQAQGASLSANLPMFLAANDLKVKFQ